MLGDGTQTSRAVPVPVAGAHRFRLIRAYNVHTCGVTTDYEAYCWGANNAGQLGVGTDVAIRRRPTRVYGARKWRQLAVGGLHTCGTTTDNRGFCWGWGGRGQIGDGRTLSRWEPRRVGGGLLFERIQVGGHHSCGIATDGRTYCWGYNNLGQVGDGSTDNRLRPARVTGGLEFSRLELDEERTCGVGPGNYAFCWGWWDGVVSTSPVEAPGGLQLRVVTVGPYHNCGVTPSNLAYCWGNNQSGQLGDGTTEIWRDSPVPVVGP